MTATTRDNSVVETAARDTYESGHLGRCWDDAPAWLRDRVRRQARDRAGVADDD
ncbi:hypothetical protein [Actinosynnema sp. NPDC023587]|uniref:hypothetical protein n=1 Tax=Actinosynnema sp. NPDC023587 TaxID=3154695 RepID=UPI0033DA442E